MSDASEQSEGFNSIAQCFVSIKKSNVDIGANISTNAIAYCCEWSCYAPSPEGRFFITYVFSDASAAIVEVDDKTVFENTWRALEDSEVVPGWGISREEIIKSSNAGLNCNWSDINGNEFAVISE